ncbi:hypothetical protein D3H55_16535 [Bacillus salacetis]|uniref:Uncharacterized protein n=1 Tax=Bacillus salacetis TaxID=2315464 RepID=A0A3A1QWN0_9BACI|nr:hypothetical protein D3H55_16535 [Bacillus salacetis]
MNCSDPNNRSLILTINQPCDGEARLYFEDLTEPGFYRILAANGNSACPMVLIIEAANGATIERTVPYRQAIYIENLKRIYVGSAENSDGICAGTINIDKTFGFC